MELPKKIFAKLDEDLKGTKFGEWADSINGIYGVDKGATPYIREDLCCRSESLMKGCVVMMSGSSGMKGYGNAQCVQEVMVELGVISLYGHNQHYKIHHILRVLEYPIKSLEAECN